MSASLRLDALPLPSPFDPEAVPEELTLTRARDRLRLRWRDGSSDDLSAETLRLACRCAWCTRDRIQERFPEHFAAVAIDHVEAKGGYAVHIAFSDGHARGIFPFSYLKALADGPLVAAPPAVTLSTHAAASL